MKKILLLFAATIIAIGMMAQLKTPSAVVNGIFDDYEYFYVVPTGGVTSSSGVHGNAYGVYGGTTKTIVPSETIKGFLMQKGYNILPSINPDLLDRTLVVSYGYTGRRTLDLFSYASGIIIQMRNAKTHALVASFEAEGCGEDETDDIFQAIKSALTLFQYSVHPNIVIEFNNVSKNNVFLSITNQTPRILKQVSLCLKYYIESDLVYEQLVTINATMTPSSSLDKIIKRDKPARNKDYIVKAEVIGFN